MGTDPPELACKLNGGEARAQSLPFCMPRKPESPPLELTQVNLRLPSNEDRLPAFNFPSEENILRSVPSFATAPREKQGIWGREWEVNWEGSPVLGISLVSLLQFAGLTVVCTLSSAKRKPRTTSE